MTPDFFTDIVQNNSTLDETLTNEQPAAFSFNIDGGNFTHIGGNLNHYHIQGDFHQHNSELGLFALGQSISHGAIHDSSERFPPSKCHPDTRRRVLKLLKEWIKELCPKSTVLWVYGPAGAGKSAILQSIAEWCLDSGNYGASFFFARGKHGRDTAEYLFATIAYQLAINIPGLREHVDQIMTSTPGCHMKNMAIQIRALIIESLSQLREHPACTPTVIIDGLDECEDYEVQRIILGLIAEALFAFKVSLRFLIASRPEAHIREMFNSSPLRSITRRIALDESFNPNNDIEIYLRHGFATIYHTKISVMSHVEKPWPADDIVDLLVEKASGQFIYAATVLKFVGEELSRPTKQLEIILEPSTCSSTTFPDLDTLYTQILSTLPNKQTLLQVLGIILALHCPQPPEVIEGILDLEQGEVDLVLRGLQSLVKVPGVEDYNWREDNDERDSMSFDKDETRFYHASFHEYIVDENRSGPFHIDIEKARAELTLAGFRLIVSRVSRGSHNLSSPDPRTWKYLKSHLSPHFWGCTQDHRDTIVEMLENAERQFWTNEDVDSREEVFFDALHCAVTALVRTMYTKKKWPENRWGRHHCDIGDETLNVLLDEYPEDLEKVLDPDLSRIFYLYRDGILDHCYDRAFSSGDMGDLLDSLPGFLVMGPEQTNEGVAAILGVDIEIISGLVEKNKTFIRFNHYDSNPSPNVWLKMHVRDYIFDEDRSGIHFRNPKLHHIAICHRSLWYTFEQHWSCLTDSTQDARKYFANNFGRHLEEINIDPDSDSEICTEAIMALLHHLGCLTFCKQEQYNAPYPVLLTIWSAISRILKWIQRQRLEYVNGSSGIAKILDSIKNRIYSQILCAEIRGEERVVVLHPHFLEAEKSWIVRKGETEPFEIPLLSSSSLTKTTSIRISDDFLLLEDIVPSLTDYVTDQNLAGDLYISPDVYHTQFAEYWLQRCSASDWTRPSEPIEKEKSRYASRHWETHLMHATSSEKIFDRLRYIYDFGLIGGTRPFIESLRLVIKWLETLPEPPLDVYIRWQMIILKQERYEEDDKTANDNTPTWKNKAPLSSLLSSWSGRTQALPWVLRGFNGWSREELCGGRLINGTSMIYPVPFAETSLSASALNSLT